VGEGLKSEADTDVEFSRCVTQLHLSADHLVSDMLINCLLLMRYEH
jgi:hypothetical protein